MAHALGADTHSPWANTGVINNFFLRANLLGSTLVVLLSPVENSLLDVTGLQIITVAGLELTARATHCDPYPTRLTADRFATEYSSFNVPEPTLGLGLAGGLSYTLPRLLAGNRPLALCLALTGMALEGPDLFFTQLATNYMTHRRLDMMMERLAEVRR